MIKIITLLIVSILLCLVCVPSKNATIEVSMPPLQDSTLSPVFEKCPGKKCSCACDDPFDPQQVFGPGDFEGNCLNTCSQRSVKMLSNRENEQYGYFPGAAIPVKDTLYLVNISHYDSTLGGAMFCAASIPLTAVKNVILQIEYSGGARAHAQLRFQFEKASPVLLVPQRTDQKDTSYLVDDLFFSAEAVAPPGLPYKGDYGFRSQYVQSFRFETKEPRATMMLKILKHPTAQYRIHLKQSDAGKILYYAAHLGDSLQYSVKYHTIKRNCILEVFNAIDHSANVSWWRKPILLFTNRTLFAPTHALQHLRNRGLVDKANDTFRFQNFEDELGWSDVVDQELVKELEEVAKKW